MLLMSAMVNVADCKLRVEMYIQQREEQELFYLIFVVRDLLVLVTCWRRAPTKILKKELMTRGEPSF